MGYELDLSYLRLCKGYLFVMGNSRMITHEIQKDISHLMSIGDFYVSPSHTNQLILNVIGEYHKILGF